jgi:outer membrane protein W
MKKLTLAWILALGIIGNAGAQTFASSHSYDLYTANEGSVDVFGVWGSRNKDGGVADAWGPGVGANYFFTENIGAGLDTYTDGIRLPYLLNLSGIVRYPVPQIPPLAAYGFGGIGRQWEHAAQWTGHIGVGAEYRFKSHTGAFVDVREVFPASTQDYTVFRFGLRFKFR